MGGDAANPLFEQTHTQITPHGHRRPGRRRQRHFPIGSVVEVQTDEEDFKGVYFSATVLPPPNSPKKSGRKRSRKLYVEYHNLLAHEDGSDRLREYVDVAFVRPGPPLQEVVKGFDPDDVVDAFYKDGWWTGVVSRPVADGERYVVTFHNPPDELEFGLGELRAHWDWVNGNWVRPQRQSIAGLMFDVGRKVEVSFDREDFQDAWFPATIHEDLGNRTFLVEYKSVNTDNHSPPKTRIDFSHIRPCPPHLKDKNFVLLEKVDAFFDFGWWSGIITKELENSRYLVFFKQMKCDKEFNQSELRPHMDWKDGKWFTSSQEPSVPSLDNGVCQHLTPENFSASVGTAPLSNSVNGEDTCGAKTHSSLILRDGHFEQFISDNQKLTKRRGYLSDSGGAISQPLKKLREGNLVVANKEDGHNGSNKEFSCRFESPKSLNNMEKSVAQTTLDQFSSNHPWEENVQRKQRNSRTAQTASEKIKSTCTSLEKSTAPILPLESLGLGSGGIDSTMPFFLRSCQYFCSISKAGRECAEKEPDTAGNAEEATQNEHAKRDTELPIVIGLPCAETGSSGKSGSNRSQPSNNKILISLDDQRHQVFDFTTGKITDAKQLGSGEVSEKRKRGRPKRIPVESSGTLATGSAEHGGQNSGDIDLNRLDDGSQGLHDEVVIGMGASVSDQEKMTANQEMTANGQSAPGKRKVRMTKRILAEEAGVEGSVRLAENRPFKRGRKHITSGRIAVKVRDSVGVSGATAVVVNHSLDVEQVIEPQPSNEFDNEPLSKWIEEMHMSSVIDGSRPLPADTVMVQCPKKSDTQGDRVGLDEASEKQPEIERQSSRLEDNGDAAPTKPQSLPSENNVADIVLDEGTRKQSENGTQSLPSMEETSIILLDLNSEKQPGDKAPDTVMVGKSPMISCQPQCYVEMAVAENEAQATATVDESSMTPSPPRTPVEKTVCEHNEENEKQPENGTTPAASSVDKVALVPREPEKLPFEKNTVLWKTIEAMEVFQRLPQKPHFQPLEKFKESSREGLAIGYMVTFSSVVERASKLQPNDPVSIMDDIKETLTDLEKQGFEVGSVQDCINELLAMKDKEEMLTSDAHTLNGQITEHSHTKIGLERDMEEIDEHIQRLQRKRSEAESAKAREDEEIAFLQVRLRETQDSIKTLKNDFKGKVSRIL